MKIKYSKTIKWMVAKGETVDTSISIIIRFLLTDTRGSMFLNTLKLLAGRVSEELKCASVVRNVMLNKRAYVQ